MGRFETTAEAYLRFREPYPPAFFQQVASRLALRGTERLIDLGRGPGVLALGFRAYVGSVAGVDPEPNMLAEARRNAEEAGIDLPLFAGRTEDLPEEIGTFDIISIGRALHWMDLGTTIPVLDRILRPGGAILVCGARPVRDDRNPWLAPFEDVIRRYSSRQAVGWESFYRDWTNGSPFVETDVVETPFSQPITPESLFARLLTRSSTSAAVLGDRLEACRADLAGALAPHFPDGTRDEILVARANIYRRG